MEKEDSNSKEKKDFFEDVKKAFMDHYFISQDVTEKLSQQLWKNPKEALDNLFKVYGQALDKVYTDPETGKNMRSFVEATCGGSHEAIPSAVYNSVGAIYPFLDREMKNYALGKILNIMDGINNRYIQISHTPYIRGPLLLADICIARPLYWPGLEGEEGDFLIKKYHPLFCDFKSELINEEGFFNKDLVKSDFIVGYSLLRKDFCNWGEEYIEMANPKFLDRVVNGISGMRFAFYSKLKNLSDGEIEELNKEAKDPNYFSNIEKKLKQKVDEKIQKGQERLRELLPKSIHGKIDEKLEKKDWADPLFLQRHKFYLLKYWIEDLIEE